jgi:tryptophan-rich sensory protein
MREKGSKIATALTNLTPRPWHIYLASSLMILAWILVSRDSYTPPESTVYLLLASTLVLTYLAWKGVLDRLRLDVPRRVWIIEIIVGLTWSLVLTEYDYHALLFQSPLPHKISQLLLAVVSLPHHTASALILILSLLNIYLTYKAIYLLTPVTALLTTVFTGHVVYAARAARRDA